MAQSAHNTHTTNPGTFGMESWGVTSTAEDSAGIQSANNLVISYPAAASTTYYKRDLVLVDTTAGTLTKCSAKGSVFDGIVLQQVDNSSGAAGARFVPVGVKGIFEFNGFVEASGQTEDDTITFNDLVYLSDDSAGVGAGQKLTALSATSTLVGRALDYNAVGATGGSDQNIVLRVYIDALSKSIT